MMKIDEMFGRSQADHFLVGGEWNKTGLFFIIYWEESSQVTNVFRGVETTNQNFIRSMKPKITFCFDSERAEREGPFQAQHGQAKSMEKPSEIMYNVQTVEFL